MTKQPHVLILMADQMQADRLGQSDPWVHTPHLDALAAEGTTFSHCIVPLPQCSPCRASMVTGQYPHQHGVMTLPGFHGHRNAITTHHTTLGRVFQDAGYRTAFFGKCHVGADAQTLGYEVDGITDGVAIDDDEAARHGWRHVPQALRSDHLAHHRCVEWLRATEDDDRPLFLTFSSNLPHPPFYREPDFDHHAEDALPLPPSWYHETWAGKPPFQRAHAEDGKHGAQDPVAARRELADYLSMIGMLDRHVGDVIQAFKDRGWWDDTVVLFTADHGDMMAAHQLRVKGTLPYDELLRVPCLLKLPRGERAPARVPHLINQVHLPALLLSAAGIAVPPSFEDVDLLGQLHDPARFPPPDEQQVFFEHYAAYWGVHPLYGVRTHRWKYVRYYGDDDCEELYHLEADPHELDNRAADPACAATLTELRERADTWWRETGGRDAAHYASDAFKAGALVET